MQLEDEGRRNGNLPEVEALRAALVRLKEDKDLSLTVLARDSHISRSTWNRVLKGESFPPRKEIERLSRRPSWKAQHLVGLWEAADAAIKQAKAAGTTPDAGPAAPTSPDDTDRADGAGTAFPAAAGGLSGRSAARGGAVAGVVESPNGDAGNPAAARAADPALQQTTTTDTDTGAGTGAGADTDACAGADADGGVPVTPGGVQVGTPAGTDTVPTPAGNPTKTDGEAGAGDAGPSGTAPRGEAPDPAERVLPAAPGVTATEAAAGAAPAAADASTKTGSSGPAPDVSSPNSATDTTTATRQDAADRERETTGPGPHAAGTELGVVRPIPAPASAVKTGRAAKLLIALLALTVVLLIGRWAAMPDGDTNNTATPAGQGETLPAAPGNAGENGESSGNPDSGNAGENSTGESTEDKNASGNTDGGGQGAPEGDGPAAGGGGNKPQDASDSPLGDDSPAPGAPAGGDKTTPRPGPAPQDENPATTPPATTAPPATAPPPAKTRTTAPAPTTAAPTTAAPLGEEGRTACAHYRPNRRVILAEGMVGTNVAQVQCLLNHNYGYSLDEDGKFGPATTAGVKAIQNCSGITADGKVGPNTWKYLDYPKAACAR